MRSSREFRRLVGDNYLGRFCTAFNNLAEEQELTRRYAGLCHHYGMLASRCNPGQSQEDGSIESRPDSLKTAVDQALRLRGSRCFDERSACEALVETIVEG